MPFLAVALVQTQILFKFMQFYNVIKKETAAMVFLKQLTRRDGLRKKSATTTPAPP